MIKRLLNVLLLLLVCSLSFAHERVTYIHTDTLGSPVAASDEDGNIIWRESYQPYGKRLQQEQGSDRPWYTGKYEEDIGLVYYGKRWYNPEIGRFYSVDPARFNEQNIHSFNRYAYANNNPYAYIDPNGEEPLFLAVFRRDSTIDQAMERSEPFRRSLEVGGTLVYGVGAAVDTGTDIASPLKGGVKRGIKWLFKDTGKGLITPNKYFRSKTKQEVKNALEKKYGPPKSSREHADTYYNDKTKRSYNVHEESGHNDGKPHIDIRRRGGYDERKYNLKEGE